MNQIVGYDYLFVETLSEDFTCVFCHLALKNPLQVEDCGHIFCKGCFGQMKQNAETNSEDLCCPLDREKIDPTHVFKDKATERRVLNLNVKCPNFGDKCEWSGELREVKEHEATCLNKNTVIEIVASVRELKQLMNRMDEQLVEKNRLIENQSQEIRNLSEQLENQSEEINSLKQLNEKESKCSSINTAFQWKFDVDQVKSGMRPYSPLFYNTDGNCFQLGAYYEKKDFKILLYRYRGQFDLVTSEITTNKFNYDIYVMGKNGNNKQIHTYDRLCNKYIIKPFNNRSNGFYFDVKSDEIDEHTISGYIHTNCIMK